MSVKIQFTTQTWTRFGLRTSNLAFVMIEVEARGPANWTEFWTVKFSESIVWDISSTLTNGSVPLDNSGNKPAKDVYLRKPQVHPWVGKFQFRVHNHYLPSTHIGKEHNPQKKTKKLQIYFSSLTIIFYSYSIFHHLF